jgi:hypothetical protein
MTPKPFTLGRVSFHPFPRPTFQVFDARNRCIGAWETLDQALTVGLAQHPKGYLIACDEYHGRGMSFHHVCSVPRWGSPGPQRVARVPGFEPTPTKARAIAKARR